MTTWAEAAAQMISVVGRLTALQGEQAAWSAGVIDGGPNGDGNYPFTQPDGIVHLVPCPAKLLFAHGDPTAALAELRGYAERAEAAATVASGFGDTFENNHSLAIGAEPIFRIVNALGYQIAVIRADLAWSFPGFDVDPAGSWSLPGARYGDAMQPGGFRVINAAGYQLGAFEDTGALRVPGGRWRGQAGGGFVMEDLFGRPYLSGDSGALSIAGTAMEATDTCLFAVINQAGYAVVYVGLDGVLAGTSGGGGTGGGGETPSPPDVTPVIGDQIWLVSDRSLPLFPANLWPARTDDPMGLVTLDSRKGLPTQPFLATGERAPLLIDPARCGAAMDLTVRRLGDRATRLRRSLTVATRSVPVAGAPAPRLLFIGDSITNRETAYHCKLLLNAWGFVPTFAGTIVAQGSPGQLGEGREGWALSDYIGTRMDGDVASVVAVGGEATYQSQAASVKRTQHVFLNPNLSSGSASPTVTVFGTQYKFDLRFYLSRFSIADPSIVVINLGMNDDLEQSAADALTDIQTLYPILLNEVRRALPSAKILLWAPVMPVEPGKDVEWAAKWLPMLKAIVSMVRTRRATDANLHLVSTWVHMTGEVGFDVNPGTTDAAIGVTTTIFADAIHPIDTSRQQAHEALAMALANLS